MTNLVAVLQRILAAVLVGLLRTGAAVIAAGRVRFLFHLTPGGGVHLHAGWVA